MRYIKKWYKALCVFLSVYVLAVGALLIAAAVRIYAEGTAPENVLGAGVYVHPVYSAEIVAQHFKPIAGIVYGFLAFALLMCVLSLFRDKPKERVSAQTLPTVRMLERRMDASRRNAPEGQAVLREQSYRKKVLIAQWIVYLLCILGSAAWLLAPESFSSKELEGVMAQLVRRVFPWVALGLAVACLAAELSNRSAARELPLLRGLLAHEAPEEVPPASKRGKMVLMIAAYAAAVCLIVLGVCNQGMRDVLVKAINICTECVGLG